MASPLIQRNTSCTSITNLQLRLQRYTASTIVRQERTVRLSSSFFLLLPLTATVDDVSNTVKKWKSN